MPLLQAPALRREHEHEFARRGGIGDLAGEFERLRPTMALTFPFELDVFQKEAVVHMEAGRWGAGRAAGTGGAMGAAVNGWVVHDL
jgi:hypothetical protein